MSKHNTYRSMLHDPQVYPRPELFLPERFLDANGQMKKLDKSEDPGWVAFGFGRRCVQYSRHPPTSQNPRTLPPPFNFALVIASLTGVLLPSPMRMGSVFCLASVAGTDVDVGYVGSAPEYIWRKPPSSSLSLRCSMCSTSPKPKTKMVWRSSRRWITTGSLGATTH